MEAAEERDIAEYRVICVVRREDGHLRAIGYSKDGNSVMYDDLWTVAQARQAIEEGNRLYIVGPATGEQADLEVHAESIRTRSRHGSEGNRLDDLPACG